MDGWGQTVGAPVAIEAGTAGWEASLGGGQTQPPVVAVMGATGGGSLAAGGAFKTLQRGEERLARGLVSFFPLLLKILPDKVTGAGGRGRVSIWKGLREQGDHFIEAATMSRVFSHNDSTWW